MEGGQGLVLPRVPLGLGEIDEVLELRVGRVVHSEVSKVIRLAPLFPPRGIGPLSPRVSHLRHPRVVGGGRRSVSGLRASGAALSPPQDEIEVLVELVLLVLVQGP